MRAAVEERDVGAVGTRRSCVFPGQPESRTSTSSALRSRISKRERLRGVRRGGEGGKGGAGDGGRNAATRVRRLVEKTIFT